MILLAGFEKKRQTLRPATAEGSANVTFGVSDGELDLQPSEDGDFESRLVETWGVADPKVVKIAA